MLPGDAKELTISCTARQRIPRTQCCDHKKEEDDWDVNVVGQYISGTYVVKKSRGMALKPKRIMHRVQIVRFQRVLMRKSKEPGWWIKLGTYLGHMCLGTHETVYRLQGSSRYYGQD